jgi:hypothetical protein
MKENSPKFKPSEFTLDVKAKRNYQKVHDRYAFSGFYDEFHVEDNLNDFEDYVRFNNLGGVEND